MQVVRHELVVALEIVIRNVEVDGSVLAFAVLANDLDGLLMSFEQWLHKFGDEWFGQYIGKRLAGEVWNELGSEFGILRGFDDHRKTHRWLARSGCDFGPVIGGSINDVSPLDHLGNGRGIESESRLGDG